jgi:hypothetical protein
LAAPFSAIACLSRPQVRCSRHPSEYRQHRGGGIWDTDGMPRRTSLRPKPSLLSVSKEQGADALYAEGSSAFWAPFSVPLRSGLELQPLLEGARALRHPDLVTALVRVDFDPVLDCRLALVPEWAFCGSDATAWSPLHRVPYPAFRDGQRIGPGFRRSEPPTERPTNPSWASRVNRTWPPIPPRPGPSPPPQPSP